MECNYKGCEKQGIHRYKMVEVKFAYCEGHKEIPDNIIKNKKIGFCMFGKYSQG